MEGGKGPRRRIWWGRRAVSKLFPQEQYDISHSSIHALQTTAF